MNIRKHIASQKGLSLLEVLAFITILSLVFLGTAYSTGQSLKRTKFNEQKLVATRLAEELEEWLRGEKEEDWTTFYGTHASPGGTTYCFDDSVYDSDNNIAWPSSGACGTSYGLKQLYLREVTLTQSLTSQVQVVISVRWKDGQNVFSVPISTILTKWE
jgi:type II secretory pathway pseudopilin PulG